MSQADSYLGLDLGTSGLKATLISADGIVLAETEAVYDVRAVETGAAETDPAAWEAALRRVVGELAHPVVTGSGTSRASHSGPLSRPRAIGVTGQMHGVVPLSASRQAIGAAVLWPDQRATPVLAAWQALPESERKRLANPVVAGMAGPILTRLTAPGGPEQVEPIESFRSPKDWLRSRFTGDFVTEPSDASATLLWDMVAGVWSAAAVDLAGLTMAELPTVVASGTVVGATSWPGLDAVVVTNSADAGAAVPVVAGGADTAAALTALRAVPGVPADPVVVNAGTGIQLLRTGVAGEPRKAPATHLYADCEGGFYEMLAVQNGGFALSWARQALGLEWAELIELAGRAEPGAAGAVFVPWLSGERGAIAPIEATGGFVGLTSQVGRADLARAALEAYAFTIRRAVELLAGSDDLPLVLSGGGLRDTRVRRLVVDVLGRPGVHVAMRSASAVGAAVLAARGVGEAVAVHADLTRIRPREAAHRDALDSAYERWLGHAAGSGGPPD